MYNFINFTWNTVKGVCPHNCSYCYCKRWGKQPELHFDKRELKTDLGEDNFIFVGSSCDLFAEAIPHDWIINTLNWCNRYSMNSYLFQSKNPARMGEYLLGNGIDHNPATVCTTIETNRRFECMGATPTPWDRAYAMAELGAFPRYVTIEPILDFDLEPMVELIRRCEPEQVNIGADSGGHHLPEPSAVQVLALIDELSKFTRVEKKENLARILARDRV